MGRGRGLKFDIHIHMNQPQDLETAATLALEEALKEAGYSPSIDQPVAPDLDDCLLHALWENDSSLQQAARWAVSVNASRLVREGVYHE